MGVVTDYRTATTVDDFRANLAAVRNRIDEAARAAGRDPAEVRLLPVSKTVEADRLRNAVEAGCDWFGENKVQEAKRKHADLDDTGVKWAVIGHLQTNKAKDVAAIADEFQALDSLRLAEALDRRLQLLGRGLDVYVQVNTSGEESKFGLAPDDLPEFLRAVTAFETLRVRGLMTLAALSADEKRVRGCFALLRELRDRAREDDPALIGPGELSMGMSGDYALAIAEGSTCVRVGQAIFGARATPDSHYWPS
ncbi:YggS family pyridoxal phosphate-dependent enzyme [Gordonia sp. X0973]|uniref:YggS family pyridoxal phosphate-dependent enzyme n=1 Tax=Gordonia sp. X0973 TaxID=2742602 RepID=UPI000F53B2A8|nr:YggS family pyridoxal phosphate-dependent enzyme [Gordonia sp. X0973]QKT08391.1 YggS family pyridoxal phosphate-dependent enzyme [Gordonia sp. X0973]